MQPTKKLVDYYISVMLVSDIRYQYILHLSRIITSSCKEYDANTE